MKLITNKKNKWLSQTKMMPISRTDMKILWTSLVILKMNSAKWAPLIDHLFHHLLIITLITRQIKFRFILVDNSLKIKTNLEFWATWMWWSQERPILKFVKGWWSLKLKKKSNLKLLNWSKNLDKKSEYSLLRGLKVPKRKVCKKLTKHRNRWLIELRNKSRWLKTCLKIRNRFKKRSKIWFLACKITRVKLKRLWKLRMSASTSN